MTCNDGAPGGSLDASLCATRRTGLRPGAGRGRTCRVSRVAVCGLKSNVLTSSSKTIRGRIIYKHFTTEKLEPFQFRIAIGWSTWSWSASVEPETCRKPRWLRSEEK
eukprot:259297-Prymnesium_polylepis.1